MSTSKTTAKPTTNKPEDERRLVPEDVIGLGENVIFYRDGVPGLNSACSATVVLVQGDGHHVNLKVYSQQGEPFEKLGVPCKDRTEDMNPQQLQRCGCWGSIRSHKLLREEWRLEENDKKHARLKEEHQRQATAQKRRELRNAASVPGADLGKLAEQSGLSVQELQRLIATGV